VSVFLNAVCVCVCVCVFVCVYICVCVCVCVGYLRCVNGKSSLNALSLHSRSKSALPASQGGWASYKKVLTRMTITNTHLQVQMWQKVNQQYMKHNVG